MNTMNQFSTQLDIDSRSIWENYYRKIYRRTPSLTLLKALDICDANRKNKFAIDLGCGSGRDTIWLLQNKWKVLAIGLVCTSSIFSDKISSYLNNVVVIY